MGKCRLSPKHRRVSMGKGKASDYRKGFRGHQWEGHGSERRCTRCRQPPDGLMEGLDYPGNNYDGKMNSLTRLQRLKREARDDIARRVKRRIYN